jgi:large subunit ribosomal protein L1
MNKITLLRNVCVKSLKLNPISFNIINCPIRTFASTFSKSNLLEKRKLKKEQTEKEKKEESSKKKEKKEKSVKDTQNQNPEEERTPEQQRIALKNKVYASPVEALEALRNTMQRSPNESVDIVIGLNVDIKRGDQNVRGIFKMPGGANKIPKLVVFTSPPFYDIALKAGADFIGDSSTLKDVHEGKINFDKCIATMDMLPSLKNVGRILGPKGLMPNTKVGTACTFENLPKIIKEIKMGSKEFKIDSYGQVLAPVGKRAYPDKNIFMNIDSLMRVLQEKRPDTIKGRYYLYSYLTTTGRSYKIDMKTLDPKSIHYFMNKDGGGIDVNKKPKREKNTNKEGTKVNKGEEGKNNLKSDIKVEAEINNKI